MRSIINGIFTGMIIIMLLPAVNQHHTNWAWIFLNKLPAYDD